MAIDTENRRRSVLKQLPVPDGTISAADRAQVVWHYSGIAFIAVTVVEVSDVDFVMETWTVAPAFAIWTIDFDLDSET